MNKIVHGGRDVWVARYRSTSGVDLFVCARRSRGLAQEQLEQWRIADEHTYCQHKRKEKTLSSSLARIHSFDVHSAILGCKTNDRNMCVRPHTSDDKAVVEVFRGYYGWREWRPRVGDRYLDLGMNIGAVFCWASKYGVHADLGVDNELRSTEEGAV